MSDREPFPEDTEHTAPDLTEFQRAVLTVLAEKPDYGVALKRELESYYGEEVAHGRLYSNLDRLVSEDLVTRTELNERTNQYELTEEGYRLLLGELEWQLSKVVTDEERAERLRDLIEPPSSG